jgi:alpha-glucosidase
MINRFNGLIAVLCCAGLVSACLSDPDSADGGVMPEPEVVSEPPASVSGMARVSSPDGALEFMLDASSSAPLWSLTYDGQTVIAPSALGFRFADEAALERGLSVTATREASHDSEWEQPWGERRFVRDHHNEIVISLRETSNDQRGFDLRVRAFDTGIGFRYEVTDGGNRDQTRRITEELTRFVVSPKANAWWIPGTGWNRYEYPYQKTHIDAFSDAHTPLTLQLPDDGPYIAIHEAALIDYSGMVLKQRRPGVLQADLAPAPDGTKVTRTGAFTTPWRTVQVARDAVGLINSDIILNLNAPNTMGDVSWVKPGKYVGIWWEMHINRSTWGSGERHGATNENTRRYLDFAAEHGFDGVLVEGWNTGWDGDWFFNGAEFSFTQAHPNFDIEALSAYANEKGVALIGHHETSGHLTNYETQMADAFALYGRLGYRHVKTGYVADVADLVRVDAAGIERREWHYGQYAVNHHIRVLEEAAKHRIAINAHEPVKDTGLRRTYPNWLTREGARGQEFNAWGNPPNPAEHVAMLAFTRMLSGPMDYTPGIFDLMPNGPDDENRVRGTIAAQLAHYVVLYSPLHMAADLPENYEARPDLFQFIKDVPTDWDRSIALDGAVGEYVVFARKDRASPDWYLGAVTDDRPRDLVVPLTFLEEGRNYTATLYRDGENASWRAAPYEYAIESRRVSADDRITLNLASGGGVAIRFVVEKE